MRTFAGSWDTYTSAQSMRPALLIKANDLRVPIKVTSGIVTTWLPDTFDRELIDFSGQPGPVLDWRGGMFSPEDYIFTVKGDAIWQHDDTVVSTTQGATGLRSMQSLLTAIEWDATSREVLRTIGRDDSSEVVTLWVAFVELVNPPVFADRYIFHLGQVQNVTHGADYLTIAVEVGSDRSWLDQEYFSYLGSEASGDENYDSSKDISTAGEGKRVPILYSPGGYKFPILPVHDKPTKDDSASGGLMCCVFDCRFRGAGAVSSTVAGVYIWDGGKSRWIEVLQYSYLSSPNVQWSEFLYSTDPDSLGGVTTANDGCFVWWGDIGEGGVDGYGALAPGGELLLKIPLIQPDGLAVVSGSSPASGAFEDATDGDSSTSCTISNTSAYPSFKRHIGFKVPPIPFGGWMHRLFLRCKWAQASTPTAGDYMVSWLYRPYTGSSLWSQQATASGRGVANWQDDSIDFNNYDGADSQVAIGFYPQIDSSASSGMKELEYTADLANAAIILGTDSSASSGADSIDTTFYEGAIDAIVGHKWERQLDNLYADAEGIIDDGSGTYTGSANSLITLPCDVLYHYVTEVLGQSNKVDTSNFSSLRTDMSSLELAFCLHEGFSPSPAELLRKISMQSMSFLTETNGGKLKMIYRPTIAIDDADAEDPLTIDGIIDGTFSASFTPRDELYSGVIVNYGLNAGSGKFDSQYRILKTGHNLTTNVSSPTDYQAIADAVTTPHERVLTLDADLVQDSTHAELLCKWYFQQHVRQRHVLSFGARMNWAKYEAGDLMPIDHHATVAYSWGEVDWTSGSPATVTKRAPFEPQVGAHTTTLAEHPNDLIIQRSSEGTNSGCYRIASVTSHNSLTLDAGHTVSTTTGAGEYARIVPAYLVLKSSPVWDKIKGPYMQFECIEAPILRAGASSI